MTEDVTNLETVMCKYIKYLCSVEEQQCHNSVFDSVSSSVDLFLFHYKVPLKPRKLCSMNYLYSSLLKLFNVRVTGTLSSQIRSTFK